MPATLLAGLVAAMALAGCSSAPLDYAQMPPEHGGHHVIAGTGRSLNCVPFARDHSDVKIFGDAVTWWDQADGRYARADAPTLGSILVLHDYAGPKHGHLAVVRTIVNSREIRVDHANWLNDGSVYLNDPVADVSANNDWTMVRVWNIPNNAWGLKVYPVQGFIGPSQHSGAIAQSTGAPAVARGGSMGPVAFTGN